MNDQTTPDKLLLVRVQDDLHGARHDGNQLSLHYTRTGGSDRNTLHWSVNSIVNDTPYGAFNVSRDGDFKGRIVVIADPKDMPIPAGWNQVDAWWRLRGERDADGRLHRSLPVGDATIVAPVGTQVPEGAKAVFYDGGIEARDAAVKQVFAEQGADFHQGNFWGWTGHGQLHEDWQRETAARLWPGQEQHIHLGAHQGSLDHQLENATLAGYVQAMKEHGRLYDHASGAQEPYVDVMSRRADAAREDVHRLLTQVATPAERPLIEAHYQDQLQRIDRQLQDGRDLDQKLIALLQPAPAAEGRKVPPPLQEVNQTLPPLLQQAQMPPPLPQEPTSIAAQREAEPSSAQLAKATIKSYEVSGAFELIAQGREPRFYDSAQLAGEAFYAARREEQPRVIQHVVDGIEDRTGKYENQTTRTIAITAPGADGKLQHVFLDDSQEFRTGYEAARRRMPAKAVETEDLAQSTLEPVPQQQAVSLQSPAAEPSRQSEVPTLATSAATEPKGQPVRDQQAPTQPQQEGPAMSLARLQIDGVDVGRLAFEKHSTEHGVFVDLTVLDRNNQPLAEFNGVDKNDLTKVLGPTVGHEVAKFNGRTGELSGQQLDVPATEVQRPIDDLQPTQAAPVKAKVRTERAARKQESVAPKRAVLTGRQMEINGLPVERLAFAKKQTPAGLRYEVAAYGAGDKLLGRHLALRKEDLADHLGASPAKHLLGARGRNGSLRGDQLELPAGEPRPTQNLSPQPDQVAKQAVVDGAAQAVAREVVEQVAAAKPSPEIAPVQESQKRSPLPEQETTAPAPSQNASPEAGQETLSPGQSAAPVVNSIERYDGPTRVHQPEAPAPQKAAKQQEAPARQAAPAAQTRDQQPVSSSPPVPVEDAGQAAAEKRRQELLASLAQRFTINAGEYRFRSEQHRVAFVDRERTVTTDRNEPEVARAMVDLAEAKGWRTVQLKGTEPFRAAAWMEASVRGLKSVGYEPTRADLVRLQERIKDQQVNRVELGQEPDAARQPPAQQQVRQPVKPRDLSEADRYSRAQALGVLEAYLKSQNTPPEKMATLMARGGEWLDKQAALGKGYPTAQVYDMNAQRQRQVHIQPQREQAAPSRAR